MVSAQGTLQKHTRDPIPEARYECFVRIAAGGMATVYVGRLRGKHGFTRLVAIKRAHPHLVDDPELSRALIAEAKLAARLRHPNICGVLDVDEPRDELLLVMDYIEGASLAQLAAIAIKRETRLPPAAVVRIVLDVCAGLHAAHELRGDDGTPLSIVHRDVSPQNILVGVDGTSRIADFGVAKWSEATQATTAGVKGKFGYMAPEYIESRRADRRADVFAVGVTLWEALTGKRLFRADSEIETMQRVLSLVPEKPSLGEPALGTAFDAVVAKALAKDPDARYQTMAELATDLETAARAAGISPSPAAVVEAVTDLYGDVLSARKQVLRDLLKASGETSSAAGALAAGAAIEDPPTETAAGGPVTLSDARTVPRNVAPRIVAVVDEDLRPKRSRLFAWAFILIAAGIAAALTLASFRDRTASPPSTSPAAGSGR